MSVSLGDLLKASLANRQDGWSVGGDRITWGHLASQSSHTKVILNTGYLVGGHGHWSGIDKTPESL